MNSPGFTGGRRIRPETAPNLGVFARKTRAHHVPATKAQPPSPTFSVDVPQLRMVDDCQCSAAGVACPHRGRSVPRPALRAVPRRMENGKRNRDFGRRAVGPYMRRARGFRQRRLFRSGFDPISRQRWCRAQLFALCAATRNRSRWISGGQPESAGACAVRDRIFIGFSGSSSDFCRRPRVSPQGTSPRLKKTPVLQEVRLRVKGDVLHQT